jgi:hypothetical protein
MMQVRFAGLILCCTILMLAFSPAQAITVNPTAEQIQEAVEFGSTNHTGIEKTLSALYACCGTDRDLIIRTKWSKLALVSGIKADQGRAITLQDKESIIQDASLQIDIAVYGPSIEFAREYSAYARQNGKKVLPEQLHADHFQAGGKSQKAGALSAYYAIIRTYFRYDALDVTKPFTLVLVKQQGAQVYEIDTARYK